MYALIYIEINLLCIGMLLIILFRTQQTMYKQVEYRAFQWVTIALFVLLSLDIAWVLAEQVFSEPFLNTWVNAAWLFQTGVVSYCWMLFASTKVQGGAKVGRTERILMTLPLAALFVLCVLTPWTKWLFYIDANNAYHRGALQPLQMIICYGYLFYTLCKMLLCYLRETNRERRSDYLVLASFIVLPVVGSVIQANVPGLPAIWPAAVLSLLIVFVNFQNKQISTDVLTGLNNRRQLDRYLDAQALESRGSRKLYLLIMDVDRFKTINDTYGHLEGDRALMLVSSALKSVCGEYNAFLARYGGDEFAVAFQCEGLAALEELKAAIHRGVERHAAEDGLSYALTLSMGQSEYVPGEADAASRLIGRADADMYQNKGRLTQ